MTRILLLLTGLGFLLPAVSAFGDSFRYEFPQSLSLTLDAVETAEPGVHSLTARLESRLGTLHDIQVFANCSPDLVVEGVESEATTLAEGRALEWSFSARNSNGKPDELGTWIRLGVTYRPDYEKLLEIVSNVASYPDDNERKRLIDTVRKNSLSKKASTDANRVFLQSR